MLRRVLRKGWPSFVIAIPAGGLYALANLNVPHYAKGTVFEKIFDLAEPVIGWLSTPFAQLVLWLSDSDKTRQLRK